MISYLQFHRVVDRLQYILLLVRPLPRLDPVLLETLDVNILLVHGMARLPDELLGKLPHGRLEGGGEEEVDVVCVLV